MAEKVPVWRMVVEACARAAHECNRAYCIALGDHSQLAWDMAPEWQKTSCRSGVVGVLEQGNTPQMSHENWLREKAANGWTYGRFKNSETKEHPCMVPYEDLPLEQRRKDEIFVDVVTSLAKALGWTGPKVDDALGGPEGR